MKRRVYRSRNGLRILGRVFGWLLAGLLLLAVVGFFLLRSWTEYDEAGAHIRFPWKASAAADVKSAPAGADAPGLFFTEAGNGVS